MEKPKLLLDVNSNLYSCSKEECKLICSVLSAEKGIMESMKTKTLETFYNALIINVVIYKYPCMSSQEEYDKHKPVWWPPNIYFNILRNMKYYYKSINKEWRPVMIKILKNLITFVIGDSNITTPWCNSNKFHHKLDEIVKNRNVSDKKESSFTKKQNISIQKHDISFRKKKISVKRQSISVRKNIINIKELFNLSRKNGLLNVSVKKPFNGKVIVGNKRKIENLVTPIRNKTAYVKLEKFDIKKYIRPNSNSNHQTIAYPINKNCFMNYLNLKENKEVLLETSTSRKLYYNRKIPFSSNLGTRLLEARKKRPSEEYRLNKINVIEKYVNIVNKTDKSLIHPVTDETRNKEISSFTNNASDSLQSSPVQDATVNMKHVDEDMLKKYLDLQPIVLLYKKNTFYC